MTAENQDAKMWSQDHKNLRFTVEDAESLIGTTITWKMAKEVEDDYLIKKRIPNGGSEAIEIDGNTFTVKLKPEDTHNREGVYYHEAEIIDVEGRISTVAVGQMRIMPVLIRSSIESP